MFDFTSTLNSVKNMASGAKTSADDLVKGKKTTNTLKLAKLLLQDTALDVASLGVAAGFFACIGVKIGASKVAEVAESGELKLGGVRGLISAIHDDVKAEAANMLFPIPEETIADIKAKLQDLQDETESTATTTITVEDTIEDTTEVKEEEK